MDKERRVLDQRRPVVKNQGMLLVELDADGNFSEVSFLISFSD